MRVAASVKKMGLRYATITGVCRDDLEDEGRRVEVFPRDLVERARAWRAGWDGHLAHLSER